jgi:uncharacterized protein YjbI with pentapeptide repeats
VPRKVESQGTDRPSPDWSTCTGLDDCLGVRVQGEERCLAHIDSPVRKAFVASLKPKASLDLRGTPISADLMDSILAATQAKDKRSTIGDAQFDGAQFAAGARFHQTRFTGEANFSGAQFNGKADFGGAWFEGDADFKRVKFPLGVSFDGTEFSRTAVFMNAQFIGGASFNWGAWFGGCALFDGAEFNERAVFDEAKFMKGASFKNVRFGNTAIFIHAQFIGGSNHMSFEDAEFAGLAAFGGAEFTGEAYFSRAQFMKTAMFDEARFTEHASFGGAQFGGDCLFRRIQAAKSLSFGRAKFAQAGVLGPLLASERLVLDDATFERAMLIEALTPQFSCVGASFKEAATVRLRFAEIVLDGTIFAQPSTVSFAQDRFRRSDPAGEHDLFDEDSLYLDERPIRPRLLSIRRVDASTLVLGDLDLAACLFQGAHNLDKLRIEGSRPFADTPRAWRVRIGRWRLPIWRRWTRRQALAEEHHWRAAAITPTPRSSARLERPSWNPPRCQVPEWITQHAGRRVEHIDTVQQLSPDSLASLYRSLRKAQEDKKDEPGAADFYYGEMEMRRHANGTPWGERVVLWLYWLTSGYGLRGLRALVGLAIVVGSIAILFQNLGFVHPPLPRSFWGSLLYAMKSTLSLTDDEVQLTAWGGLLQVMLRILGPVLLGLALLSIRNRVKR